MEAVPSYSSLPPGWTEHTAPTGHKYYYNATTKRSTYMRPTHTPPVPPPARGPLILNEYPNNFQSTVQHAPNVPMHLFPTPNSTQTPVSWTRHYQRPGPRDPRQDPRHLKDRPKKQFKIPGHSPWLLVSTKFRRRFVHNPKTSESLWKIPKDLLGGIVELDIQTQKDKVAAEKGDRPSSSVKGISSTSAEAESSLGGTNEENPTKSEPDKAEEEEEEEIIEEIEEYEEEEEPEERSANTIDNAKDDAGEAEEADEQEYEFGEADMAAQLAEMEQFADEEGYAEDENDATGDDALAEQENLEAFKTLFRDHNVNPFSTWDRVIANFPEIIDDERYTLLSNMKSRKEAFSQWTSERIQQQKEERTNQAKQDPRIPYLAFLEKNASPKLYWPEFRRKFKKEPELKDTKLSDKDREKLYREHVNRITKMSHSTLKEDLRNLLKSIPVSSTWNSATAADANTTNIPSILLTDVRWISLKPKERYRLLHDYVDTLPSPESANEQNGEGDYKGANSAESKAEQARRERERQVDEDRRRQQQELHRGQKRLREEERELERATRLGRQGLKDSL